MKFTDKQISLFRGISITAGIFTMIVAFTMLFTLIQLKKMDPVNSPAVTAVKEQFDKEQDSKEKAEQVRAIDLMARRAYFSSRWQVETGSYLMLAGALIFVIFQRLIAGNEKLSRTLNNERPDINKERYKYRKFLIYSSVGVVLLAIISSFILRADLPSPGKVRNTKVSSENKSNTSFPEPDGINHPFLRGEGSRGIAGGEGYPVKWNGADGTNIKWKIPVPKNGKSSPVIWGNNLYITGAEGDKFEVYCIDKNKGEILWTGSASDFQGASKEVPESDAEAGMAVSTAAACEKGVYAIFGNGNLAGFDHNGKLLWGKNIGVPQHMYGFSSSLIIFESNLIVQYESEPKIAVIAFDLETGEQKWEAVRQGRVVNSSPVLAIFDGTPQIIINGSPNVVSVSAADGKELWSIDGVKNDVATSVAVNKTFVYAVANYEKLFALKPGKNPVQVWEDNTYTPDVSSPVATDEFLFVADGAGSVACYKADSNTILWENSFNDPYYASPMIAGNLVYFLDRSGVMHITKATGTYELVSESALGEEADCTPAFSEKKIYIRGKENLYCISEN